MAGSLATTTYQSGPSDDLAAVDVYTQTSDAVVNKTPDVLTAPDTTSVTNMLGGKNMAASLPTNGATPWTTVSGGSTSDLTSRIASGGSSALSSALRSLTPSLTQLVSGKLPGVTGLSGLANQAIAAAGGSNRINTSLGGISSSILPANLGNVNAITGAVGSLTNNITNKTGVLDTGALSTMISGLVGAGLKNGLGGVYTALKPSLANPAVLRSVVSSVSSDVIKSGNVGVLKEVTVSDSSIVNQVSPGFCSSFSSSYPEPVTPTPLADYASNYNDINTSFTSLDPSWAKTSVTTSTGQSVTYSDISTVVNGSDEFQKTMTIGATTSISADDKPFLLAPVISDPLATTVAAYPTAFTTAATTTDNSIPVDPRTLADSDNLAATKQALASTRTSAQVNADITALLAQYNADYANGFQKMMDETNPNLNNTQAQNDAITAAFNTWAAQLKATYDSQNSILLKELAAVQAAGR